MDETFRCTIHDIDFGIGWRGHKPDGGYAECPLCLKAELVKSAKAHAKTIEQRDMLLNCIDLKKTLQEVP